MGCDQVQAADLAARDDVTRRLAFEVWLNVPQPMKLCLFVAGVTIQAALPEGSTEEEAVACAFDLHRRERVRVCLVRDRKRSLWITRDGKRYVTEASPNRPNFPYTALR